MSQIHGSITLEIPVERIAEIVALRVVAMLGPPAGGEVYDRELDPGQGGAPPDRGAHRGRGIGLDDYDRGVTE